jgi:hypothetical protein
MIETEVKLYEAELEQILETEVRDKDFLKKLSKYLKVEYTDYEIVNIKNKMIDVNGKFILVYLQKK